MHAASDAVKEGLHLKYIADELSLDVDEKIKVGVDAGAATGFINNIGAPARLKHISLRLAWVCQLRDHSRVEFIMTPTQHTPCRGDAYLRFGCGRDRSV